MLQTWLESYGPEELFDTSATDGAELDQSSLPAEVINGTALRIIPRKEDRRMGFNKVRRARARAEWTSPLLSRPPPRPPTPSRAAAKFSSDAAFRVVPPLSLQALTQGHEALDLPDWHDFTVPQGEDDVSAMKAIGQYLLAVVERNPTSFRMFSPDELASNKLDAVFEKVPPSRLGFPPPLLRSKLTGSRLGRPAPVCRPTARSSGTPRRPTTVAASSRCSLSTRSRACSRYARPPPPPPLAGFTPDRSR